MERDLEDLREAVRSAGRETKAARLRVGRGWFWTAFIALLPLTPFAMVGARDGTGDGALTITLGVAVWAGCLLIVAWQVAAPFAKRVQERQRADLVARLASLTNDERSAILAPLRHERTRETRDIAKALMSDFDVAVEGSTDLTPSAPPEGRGDELSPAEGP